MALISVIAVGSLAWFTDSDEVENVFTFDEVNIGLNDTDGNGNPFNDDPHTVLPGVPVEKIVSATNLGNTALGGNDAYVRMFVGVPEKLDGVLDMTWGTSDWTPDNSSYVAELDGVRYKVYQFTYNGKLAAGATTVPVLTKVELDETVDCKNGKLCVPNEEGTYNYFDFDINALRELKIPVAMQAVQTGGFDDAASAFAAAFKGCPWPQAAPEDDQAENPADINYTVRGDELHQDIQFTWDTPDESGFEKLEFNIPAYTFGVPVKANIETSSDGDSCEMSISFYQLDENGNVMEDEEGNPIVITPDTDKLVIDVYSPYPQVGDGGITASVEIELGDDAEFSDYINVLNCIKWHQTEG